MRRSDTDQPSTGDRRPIASRETAWAQRVTAMLVRQGVRPNAISASSIVFGLTGSAAFVATAHVTGHFASAACFLAAAISMQLRLLANLFDGMVALGRGGPKDPVGAMWNEAPDRVADSLFLVGAGYALSGVATLGWAAALLAVMTAYVRAQGAACGARHHFTGPMAKPQRMALLTVASIVAAAIPPTMQREWQGSYAMAGVLAVALGIVTLGCAVTIIRRLQRIALDLRERAPGSERHS